MTKKMDAEWKSQNSLQFDNNTHPSYAIYWWRNNWFSNSKWHLQLKLEFAPMISLSSKFDQISWPFLHNTLETFLLLAPLLCSLGQLTKKRNAIALCIIWMQASCGEDLYWVSKVLPVLYDEKFFNLNERRPQHSIFHS